nr:hypothetical chloroplast RF1 [Dinophyceae sp. MRD-151]
MSIAVIVRNYFDKINPFFHRLDESIDQNEFLGDFLQSFFFFFETTVSLRLSSFFSFQWLFDVTYLPIVRPDIQITRTNSRIFSITPFFPGDLFPKDLNFLRFTDIRFPTTAFQAGFFNSMFLAFPRSLSFLVIFRSYWTQGFLVGLISTLGYRIGETIFLLRVTSGFGALWKYIGSPLPFVGSCVLTIFFLQDLPFQSNSRLKKYPFFFWQKKLPQSLVQNQNRKAFSQNNNIVSIFLVHLIFSWTDQVNLFRAFRNFTFSVQDFVITQSYFSFGYLVSFSYRIGLFLGGLFFDLCFMRVAIVIREYFRLQFNDSRTKWKKKISVWASRIIIAFSIRRIPFYSADYLTFSIFGFFGRDIELRQRVTRNVFSYPIKLPFLSPLFEGRYVIGEDSYGRPAPDILREPWEIGRLAIEASRDLVEETYRTQHINRRVDSVYLGVLEQKIFEWLAFRNPENSIPSRKNETLDREKKSSKTTKKSSILVRRPIRKGLGSDLTPKDFRFNSKIKERPQIIVEHSLNRFNRWFRATRRIANREEKEIFNLPLGRSIKVPENLFSLSRRSFSQQSLLSSIGILEPQRATYYSSSIELSRKRNARSSSLHSGPILRYIDLLFKTRSFMDGFSSDISTRQQQRNLHVARLILHDYVKTSRSYSEAEQISSKTHRTSFSTRLRRRVSWQRELYSYLFGGGRSRINRIYNQQYLGNLQLLRRLFVVSWSSQDIVIPSQLQVREKILLRRKISFDQITFDKQKNIFEHEELGKSHTLKVQRSKDKNQVFSFSDASNPKLIKIDKWNLLSKKRYFQDQRVEIKPLYVGWDNQRHAIILCNRFLPIDLAAQNMVTNKQRTKTKTYSSLLLNNLNLSTQTRREFTAWPKNLKIRRMRLQNARYNRRAILHRRSFTQTKNTATDLSLLSQDRSLWRRKAAGWDASIFAFWFNPRSDAQRENGIRTNIPTRTSQNFPLSLERATRPQTYVPGDFQPSTRGGLTWPGTSIFSYIPKSYYHPGSNQN